MYSLEACPLLGSVEKWQFFTDVHNNIDGTETRFSLADYSKQSFSNQYLFKDNSMLNDLYTHLNDEFSIRVPFESEIITAYVQGDIQVAYNSKYIVASIDFYNKAPYFYDVEPATLDKGQFTRCVLLNSDTFDVEYVSDKTFHTGFSATILYSKWKKKRFNLRVVIRGVADYKAFKRWLFDLKGRYGSFTVGDLNLTVRLDSDIIELRALGANLFECTLPVVTVL